MSQSTSMDIFFLFMWFSYQFVSFYCMWYCVVFERVIKTPICGNHSLLLRRCDGSYFSLQNKCWTAGVGLADFPSLNFGKIVLWSGKFKILFWRLLFTSRRCDCSFFMALCGVSSYHSRLTWLLQHGWLTRKYNKLCYYDAWLSDNHASILYRDAVDGKWNRMVNILFNKTHGSGNGLLSDGTKPLLGPSEIQWQSPEDIFIRDTSAISYKN